MKQIYRFAPEAVEDGVVSVEKENHLSIHQAPKMLGLKRDRMIS